MYPNLYFLFKDLFGVEWEVLKIFQMFGLFMAISFGVAYYVMGLELKRLEKEGILHPFKRKVWVDKAPGNNDYIFNFIFYFLAGFKVVEAFLHLNDLTSNPQEFILSTRGNLIGGLALGALGVYLVYREAQKVKGKTAKQEEVLTSPYQLMGNVVFVGALTGLPGAKLFHILENMSDFYADPMGSILSFGGLTYYGSLITGGIGVLWYLGKYKIHWRHVLDAGGTTMMISYAIGRIGCQVSGDGDWGIVNKAPKPDWMSFLPDWMWTYNYPNNVNEVCDPYTNGASTLCNFKDTPYLIDPVFPTPIYETLMCLLLFALMWSVRKKLKAPGIIFCLYLVLAGIERFVIEKIRVNNVIKWGMTQAEIISIVMVLIGIAAAFYFIKVPIGGKSKSQIQNSKAEEGGD